MAVGKIIKALSGFYYVLHEGTVYQCRGRGNFRKKKVSPLVGDIVEFKADKQDEGYILSIEKRKNEFVRPPIANVDQALIVTSATHPDFNALLLDRFLVLVEAKRIEPFIVISKMDQLDEEQTKEMEEYKEMYEQIGYSVILSAVQDAESMDLIQDHLAGRTTVIAGQSGVGKSSLLNSIDPRLSIDTDEISQSLGRGKHTTRHVELYEISNGLVADTPGFSSLEFGDLQLDQLPECFPEFVAVQDGCKFRGCLHNKEPKCAVKAGVEEGTISKQRYEHYLQFLDEIQNRKPRY
ncbi:ribosome small subunit-dependent GTPase A [Halobacillus yeomjeoni]|uniref:Small ribosomal subunit biogenesis GTPase RsgA n=1 Tax=Halobacillus yeomjeoni TaxID=311194 RepID=A0A931HSS8_9BACI|nr:ribosome small subunit-dependent GTPase A [Halobacillus yeomjeoni]MBH0229127.1 ribosome small subunit-dependent GTPase A [Halobacillus yeomjeoni]MCA0983485.1 ribosome small subunit-dependent GTPase A [Halobacillus yeomjeoni]